MHGDCEMKIKRCPFCGKRKPLQCRLDELCGVQMQVVCNILEGGCGSGGCFEDSGKQAIKAWNRRHKK